MVHNGGGPPLWEVGTHNYLVKVIPLLGWWFWTWWMVGGTQNKVMVHSGGGEGPLSQLEMQVGTERGFPCNNLPGYS